MMRTNPASVPANCKINPAEPSGVASRRNNCSVVRKEDQDPDVGIVSNTTFPEGICHSSKITCSA